MIAKFLDPFINNIREIGTFGLEKHRGDRNLYISGYPISGNTWIAYLIAYILNCSYHDIDALEWAEQRVPLKKFLLGTNAHSRSKKYDRVLKTHACFSALELGPNDRLVYNVRDGRDVVNSYFHRVEKAWPLARNWKRRLLYGMSRIIPTRVRYTLITGYFARLWAKEVQEYLDDGCLIIHYEDMLVDPLGTLEKAIAQIDPDAWDESVAQEAIEIFSFGKMKKMAMETKAAHKTDRVGGAGDWKNYFNASDEKNFKATCSEVMQSLGYF